MKKRLLDILKGERDCMPVSDINRPVDDAIKYPEIGKIGYYTAGRRVYSTSGYLKKNKLRDGSIGQQIVLYAKDGKLFDERYFDDNKEVVKRRFVREKKDIDTLLLHLRDIEVYRDDRSLNDAPKDVQPIISISATPYISMLNQFIDAPTFDHLLDTYEEGVNACMDELKRIFSGEMNVINELDIKDKLVLVQNYTDNDLNKNMVLEDVALLHNLKSDNIKLGISLPEFSGDLFSGFDFYVNNDDEIKFENALNIIHPNIIDDVALEAKIINHAQDRVWLQIN